MADARRQCVRELRALARRCGTVPTERDDVGEGKVLEMVSALGAATLAEDTRQQVEAATQAYLDTFGDVPAVPAPGLAQPLAAGRKPFRLRGTSFLLTYNWLFLSRRLPDGTAAPTTHEGLWALWLAWKANKKKELHVTQSTSTMAPTTHEGLWALWLAWKANKKKELHVAQSTSTMEQSLESEDPEGVFVCPWLDTYS
jgi:hypothetical protein